MVPGTAYNLDEFDCRCKKDNKRMMVSNHAKGHMMAFEISPVTLCDMIQDGFPCNNRKGKPHRPDARRLCANHKGRKFNIIFDPDTVVDEECWMVSNLEPIKW